MAVYTLDVFDFFFLDDANTTNIHVFSVVDTLSMGEIARTQLYILSVSSFFNVGDFVTLNRGIVNLQLADYLQITDKAARATFISLLDSLMMYDVGRTVLQNFIADFFDLSDTLNGFAGKPGRDALALSDGAMFTMVRNVSIVDYLSLAQSVSVYENNKYGSSILLPTLIGPNAPEC